ncbi:MAG TPA: Rossmann-like and DUF2520 domain-containing protein [Puia sp.]|nr:Rossmann-like and DUF2520 domain-containing protein [Puia sp.]
MKIVIIGSGNVATVLGHKISKAGHEITQIISRSEEHAANLAKQLNCGYASTFDEINKDSDVYIISISDDALMEIDKHLFLDKKLVVHTAGSVSKDVLKNVSKNYGVLYPLQSLRKENIDIPEIPLLVDANTSEDLTLIFDFAKTISDEVKMMDDEGRLKLHVGAIIVSNFSNHLYALTEDYCKKENIDFRLLLPLINQTASRLSFFAPAEMQTGPAVREDYETIKKHLDILEKYPALKKLYQLFTESIIASKFV